MKSSWDQNIKAKIIKKLTILWKFGLIVALATLMFLKKEKTCKPCKAVNPAGPRRDGRSTNARGGVLQSRRSRRARAEARAPMRGSSRVCRGVWRSRRCPARCAALRGAARRRGAARSSCAAAGCWCPAPAPPPSRGRCAQQPRAAGALCPLRRRAAGRAVAAPRSAPRRHRRVRHGVCQECFASRNLQIAVECYL